MNENNITDAELIKAAYNTHYTQWYAIDALIEQAKREETKKQLEGIQKNLYHKEEYSCGCH